jgi:hypothetical protein
VSDDRDPLSRDQDDFFARLSLDSFFAEISVLEQRKGVTESDVEVALSTLNEKAGKIGAVVIVLMPDLVPTEPDAPGPEYRVRSTVQVITQALFNESATGTQKSAEQIAQRVRQLLHRFGTGAGVFSFAGMEPIAQDAGKVSYGVTFTRLARDEDLPRCGTPLIDPDEGAAPQLVTLTCATAGASLYSTTDGSYPSSANDAATLYTAPFNVATACTLRVAAEKAGMQQSNVAEATFT